MKMTNGAITSPDRYQGDPVSFSCKASANQMKEYLSDYFNNYLRAAYTVTATYYDSPTNLTETGVWTASCRVVYNVTTLKSLSTNAMSGMMFQIQGESTAMKFDKAV